MVAATIGCLVGRPARGFRNDTHHKRPAAGAVQIHEMKMEGNVMRMRELEGGLEIAPGATVTLAPGNLHLMMMGLKEPFAKGAKVPLTLVFEKAGNVDTELSVEAMGAASAPDKKHSP